MGSRMEKYYREQEEKAKRSEKNQKLYETMYDDVEYTNIKDISRIDKTGEVDLQKIKDMLNRHQTSPKEESPVTEEARDPEAEAEEIINNYDIKQLLDEAKSKRVQEDSKKRHLESEYFKNVTRKKKTKEAPDEEKLQELINTITNTKVLKDLNNKELSEKLLSDLHGNEETQKIEQSETQKVEQPETPQEQSFYTNSLKFKDDDFEDLKELNKSMKQSTKMIGVLLTFLFIIMTGLIVYIIMRIT